MHKSSLITAATVGVVSLSVTVGARAQQPPKPAAAPTIASTMSRQLGIIEQQFVAAAKAMPAEKYGFAPTVGNFAGVRTFAQEVKHVATINYVFSSALLGEAAPAGVADNQQMNGPDTVRTKEQIIAYLEASFAFADRANATLTADNANVVLDPSSKHAGVPSFLNTRLALASFTCAHVLDHYGQMVEYLRMNGIIPPASQGQPAANPTG
ncbi:MAG: DinB family protein [Gemmatimonadaceae bacterium]